MFCIYMFSLQAYLLSQSVTWHEFNTKTYVSKSQQIFAAWFNFKSSFGQYGLLNFLFPVIPGFLLNNNNSRKYHRVKSDERIY